MFKMGIFVFKFKHRLHVLFLECSSTGQILHLWFKIFNYFVSKTTIPVSGWSYLPTAFISTNYQQLVNFENKSNNFLKLTHFQYQLQSSRFDCIALFYPPLAKRFNSLFDVPC
jgi:hypothetical protein